MAEPEGPQAGAYGFDCVRDLFVAVWCRNIYYSGYDRNFSGNRVDGRKGKERRTAEMTAKILIAAALIAGTVMTRFLPFVLFPDGKEKPRYLEYLGKTLPYAAMGLLVVYCLKGVNLFYGSHGKPELLAAALTAGLHCWKRNSLLSIGAGTAFYMILVQMVF